MDLVKREVLHLEALAIVQSDLPLSVGHVGAKKLAALDEHYVWLHI